MQSGNGHGLVALPPKYEDTPLKDINGTLYTNEQFKEIIGTVYFEMDPNKFTMKEAAGIVDATKNAVDKFNKNNGTQKTLLEQVVDEKYAKGHKAYRLNTEPLSPAKLRTSIAGVIEALTHPEKDYSNGATGWDGRDISKKITDENKQKPNPHRQAGIFYQNPAFNIYGEGNLEVGAISTDKKTPDFPHAYEVVGTEGATIFEIDVSNKNK